MRVPSGNHSRRSFVADNSTLTVLGALGSVSAVLLGAAGVNLKQLAKHNESLQKALDKRNESVDKLNNKLLDQGENIGRLTAQNEALLKEISYKVQKIERLEEELKRAKDGGEG